MNAAPGLGSPFLDEMRQAHTETMRKALVQPTKTPESPRRFPNKCSAAARRFHPKRVPEHELGARPSRTGPA